MASLAAIVTTGLALPIAILVVRHPGRFSLVLERITYIATRLPAIAISLALVVIAIRYARPIYQTTGLLLVAYSIATLPLAVVAVRVAIARIPVAVEEVAQTLGASAFAIFYRITVPLVLPGLAAAALLVFLTVMTELTATLLLAPIGTETLAMRVWDNTTTLSYGAAAPYAVLMISITMLPAYLLMTHFGIAARSRESA